ncbi:hypothetical protein KP509_23G037800 [Ceratopteris richardii]|uniref:Uncharacterized protein n=3 Tax=Ceratopteris richardii TaxID=49495 RepID=A0A8T2S1F0_CERRI|nr:hypothetical protein KP509_23G037800 [Ceratopteris richardii]
MGWKAFVEGGAASIVAGCTTHPLDLIKVRMQLQGEGGDVLPNVKASTGAANASVKPSSTPPPIRVGPIGMGARVIRQEGVSALFSGVSATFLRQATYSTTRMGLYEMMKNKWERDGKRLPLHKKVIAGLVAGGIGAAVGNPADMAMVRMQADGRLPVESRRHYKSVADAILRTAKDEGIGALWRGSSPTVVRAMLVTASQLATYDQVKEVILHNHWLKDGLVLHVVASSAAGVTAAISSNPVDVVKTRLMNMHVGADGTRPYSGPLDCAFKTIRKEGPLALYKGLIPTMFRQGPFTIVLFVTLERMRKLLRDNN